MTLQRGGERSAPQGPRRSGGRPHGHARAGATAGVAVGVLGATWLVVLALYVRHRIVLSSDSVNNYVHVWYVARDLWHHGRLPWRMPVLGHGQAYAYPYGVVNWTTAALVWPLLGDRGVTLWTVLGALGCVAATFSAFPELRRGWWGAAVLANPALNQGLLFGQQTFEWSAALLLWGIACWRRERRLAAALLVGLAQANHAAVALPIAVMVVAVWLPFERHKATLLRWYALSVALAVPALVVLLASPGYRDATTRDKVVNFFGTVFPRALVVGLPLLYVVMQRSTPVRWRALAAPASLVVSLGANVGLLAPLNVADQWAALTRTASTASLDAFLRSSGFRPGATYRVLRGSGDKKLSEYQVLLAGGRLDSELFPESMAVHSFGSLDDYERLLCGRHVDFVLAFDSYTASRRTNELRVLRDLAASGSAPVRVRGVVAAADHTFWAVDRSRCGSVAPT